MCNYNVYSKNPSLDFNDFETLYDNVFTISFVFKDLGYKKTV